MPIWLAVKALRAALPGGAVGDLLAAAIMAGAATVVLEALGIPVVDPAVSWIDSTIITPVEDSIIGWFRDEVLP